MERQKLYQKNRIPNFLVPDHPLILSVGKSGEQISEIWQDIRVDSYCDFDQLPTVIATDKKVRTLTDDKTYIQTDFQPSPQ